MSNITFRINDEMYLEMVLTSDLNCLSRYDEICVLFRNNDFEYILYYDDFIIEAVRAIKNGLRKALQNGIELHPEFIKQDIGLWYNKYIQKINENVTCVEDDLCAKYYVWATPTKIGTISWLYNYDGAIVFEVTPVYKWHYDKPEKGEEYYQFETFVSNYSPYLKVVLDRTIAVQWLKKCEDILAILESNY
jgi:hypothetical protein